MSPLTWMRCLWWCRRKALRTTRVTIRRCPGPESIRDREASAGFCWEAGKWSVAGISTPFLCCCLYVFVFRHNDLVICAWQLQEITSWSRLNRPFPPALSSASAREKSYWHIIDIIFSKFLLLFASATCFYLLPHTPRVTLGVLNINRGAQYGFISANIDSDNYLLLMAVITDNITDNFTFFCILVSLCICWAVVYILFILKYKL